MYRLRHAVLEVFLVHPGGPIWAKKDLAAWTIPKGEYHDDEVPLDAARREFQEETGFVATGPFAALGEIRQASGKIVIAWAMEGDCDPTKLVSNTCFIDWPPRSGKKLEIPEVDRGDWFTVPDARQKIFEAQIPLLDRLIQLLPGAQ
jgi:predicted NUDIX family NTP pyrophosphohydrolase